MLLEYSFTLRDKKTSRSLSLNSKLAFINMKDIEGKTAIDYARDANNNKKVEFLENVLSMICTRLDEIEKPPQCRTFESKTKTRNIFQKLKAMYRNRNRVDREQ